MTFRARVLLALAVALCINLLVAWALALASPRSVVTSDRPLAEEADERLWWLGQVPDRWGLVEGGAWYRDTSMRSGFGVVEMRTTEALGKPPDGGYRTAAGWPFASFMGGAGLHNHGWGLLLPSQVLAMPLPEFVPSRQPGRASLPIQPRWRGLLANTIVWTLVALPIVSLPSLRRWWHRYLQRCSACGHPLLPAQRACPECGTWRHRWLRAAARFRTAPSGRRGALAISLSSLVAGVLCTAALAFVAAVWSPMSSAGPLRTVPPEWPMESARSRWPAKPRSGERFVGPGIRMTLLGNSAAPIDWQRLGLGGGTPVPLLCRESIVEAGWPAPAFRGMQARHVSFFVDRLGPPARTLRGALAIPPSLRSTTWSEDRVIPLRPLWGGLALDVLVFAALFMGAALLARRWRRARRASRGRCGQCGYPMGELEACPECGTPGGDGSAATPGARQGATAGPARSEQVASSGTDGTARGVDACAPLPPPPGRHAGDHPLSA